MGVVIDLFFTVVVAAAAAVIGANKQLIQTNKTINAQM